MKLTATRFSSLADSALGNFLGEHGFDPVSAEQLGRSAFRTYRNGGRYVRISASDWWRDEEAHCQALVGEGPDSWPDTDWNSVGLRSLAGRPGWYALSAFTSEAIAAVLGVIRRDLERHAADFLAGDTGGFREARADQNEGRQPYQIHQPDEEGRYQTTVDPQSAELKERYGRGAV